jgi:hypothetical protein
MRAVLLTLCSLFAFGAHAAISLQQAIPTNWNGAGVTTESNALGTSVPAGTLLLIGVQFDDTASVTITNVTITNETDAAAVGSLFDASVAGRGQRMQWFCRLTVSTDTKTIVVNTSASANINVVAIALDLGGGTFDSCVDGGGASGTGTSAVDAVTTTTANAAVFMLGNFEANPTDNPTDYTTFELADQWWYYEGIHDLDVGAAGAQSPTLTLSSAAWAVKSVAVQTEDVGGGSIVPIISHNRRQRVH